MPGSVDTDQPAAAYMALVIRRRQGKLMASSRSGRHKRRADSSGRRRHQVRAGQQVSYDVLGSSSFGVYEASGWSGGSRFDA